MAASSAGRLPRVLGRADRRARHMFRTRRAWSALIAATLLTAVGALTAIETLTALAGAPAKIVPYEGVASWLRRTPWSSAAVLAISAVVALAGLGALAAALVPGRCRLVPLHGGDPDLLVGVTRGGLRGAAASAARSVDGISAVKKVRVRRRRLVLKARTPLRREHDLAARVHDAVQSRLDELAPVPRRKVKVRIDVKE
ncbi:hypothetical protein BTM25_37660 [Actinomadura rubteroloni]|uniref:DUF6286 domain-containing protein n=1 Tax=Actinomadura rubteroloni TaxID=1926885 RepID=A0A2P4UJ88_9ACTN|nr:DUF6286 domain-containing protein [Actinomadura rubteroloni]POM25124.1 hypothetical protein BTM25_37660 [Actinomadura rubteroloni]